MSKPDIEKRTHNSPSLNVGSTPLENEGPATEPNTADLLDRIENLEKCLSKMAHYNGGNNPRILKEFGIAEYQLQPLDMRRSA